MWHRLLAASDPPRNPPSENPMRRGLTSSGAAARTAASRQLLHTSTPTRSHPSGEAVHVSWNQYNERGMDQQAACVGDMRMRGCITRHQTL